MTGKKLDRPPEALPNPGDYWKAAHGWMGCTPDGRLCDLSRHTVIEHDDGTITVGPSILVSGGGFDECWHGYLEKGDWRQV